MKLIIRPKAEKFILKADNNLKNVIKKELRDIFQNPRKNPKLKTPLDQIRSHHFSHKKTQYRIAYIVEKDTVIILIGTRENFYKQL